MDLYRLFADVLDYPGPQLAARIRDCASRLTPEFAEAADLLRRFHSFQAGVSLGQLQETYTSIFDMQPECTLSLGYQLLGDDWRRSILLFKLKEVYQAHNFEGGCELPDHLCVLLRFLATRPDSGKITELVDECMLPALSRIASSIQLGESPYRWLVQALLSWLRQGRNVLALGDSDYQQTSPVQVCGGEERLA